MRGCEGEKGREGEKKDPTLLRSHIHTRMKSISNLPTFLRSHSPETLLTTSERMSSDQDPHDRPLVPGAVTRLAAQRRDPNRVSVFIDGTFAFGVHVDVVVEYDIRKGQNLSVDEQERLIKADEMRRAYDTALTYLGYRARTEQEIRRKLGRKGFSEAVVEVAVQRLRDLEYVDDAAYARSYAAARFRNKGYGPQRIRAELRKRGVAAALIEPVLDDLFAEDEALEAARHHAEKRWAQVAREDDPFKRRRKLTQYLVRRGFSFDTARRVVDEVETAYSDDP